MLKVFWGYFRAVILAVIVGLAAVTAAEIEKIPDASMEPLIEHDDFVFINKAVYVYKEPEAGDVVALRSRLHTSSGGGAVIASRVAGAAGDVIELPGGEKETVKEYKLRNFTFIERIRVQRFKAGTLALPNAGSST